MKGETMSLRTHQPAYGTDTASARPPSLVRWGPSFAGAISAIALTALFTALWWAIGYGSGVSFVAHNLAWFFLATVLGALLFGGVLAGRVSDVRGAPVSFYGGMAVWGLTVIAALVPLSLRGLALANAGAGHPATTTAFSISSGDIWALFGALVGGLAAAVMGALVGGTTPRATMSEGTESAAGALVGWRRTG
jgi:hypothetical protein